jgi:sulfatase maturation enzyme AslB (radical SAM superfamily)
VHAHGALTVRISLEGLQEVNDAVRGMKNGCRCASA